jgi:excisionase family DNA binding protein
MKPNFLSRKEAAEYLGLKPRTLVLWARKKKNELPFTKVGRLCKYRKEHLDEFLEKNFTRNKK